MKNLKAVLAAAVVGLSLVSPAPVIAKAHGEQAHHGERHAKRIGKMLDAVGASEQQKEDIKQVFLDRKAGMKDLKEKMKALREEEKALDARASNYDQQVGSLATRKGQLVEAKTLWKSETRKQVALILTAEQAAQMKELREQRSEMRREHRGEKREKRREMFGAR